MPPHTPIPPTGRTAAVELALTWTVTDTYTDRLPLHQVAAVTGQPADVLTADPSALRGAPPAGLIDLLTDHQDDDTLLPANAAVEITRAELVDLPTLADLVDNARQALQAESDADQPTPTGRALAALLAGLRREEVIDR